MYKILIVDDEEFIRTAIASIIDWKSIGFTCVLEAEDGELAYEIALEHRPDVILTDIRMPFMDGLELSERITKELPNTKILILTGHDEFEYAKKALKIGVLDYIVKPIRSEALRDVMINTKNILDQEKKRREEYTRIKRQLRKSLPLLKEKFYNSLICNKLSKEEIDKRTKYLEIDLQQESYTVCLFETTLIKHEEDIEDIEIKNISINNFILEIIHSNGIVFNDLSGRHVLLYFNLNRNDLEEREILHGIARKIALQYKKNKNFAVTTGIGNTVLSVNQIHQSYKDALHVLEYKVAFGKGNVFDIIDLGYRSANSYFPVKQIKKLLSTLRLGTGYQTELNELFQYLFSQKEISMDNLRIIMYEIINGVQKLLIETQVSDKLEYHIYDQVLHIQTINEMKPLLEDFFSNVFRILHSGKSSKKRQLVEKAKEYIKENYNNCELNLNNTANAIFLSPSYLSVLFKKETGETFIDFLTKIRMEKSKELLRLYDLKAYEIAEQVGYNDPHYFSISFKKYTGYTPSKYRKIKQEN